MIAMLTGTVVAKDGMDVIVDCAGVGYAVSVPLSTAGIVPDIGARVTLHTILAVREDAMQLFGFASQSEKLAFIQLTSIQGIGGRIALGILSAIDLSTLALAIGSGDIPTLQKLPGIGKKTAERIIVELRDKMRNQALAPAQQSAPSVGDDAVLALVALGYSKQVAEKSVKAVLAAEGTVPTNDILIRKALQYTAK